MHRLIALEGPPSGTEQAKPQARIDAAFEKTMILFYHVVEVFALPERTACWELPLLVKRLEG
jgi:hypothetical protein